MATLPQRTLLAEMPELCTLDRRRIEALAGLAPYTQSFRQMERQGQAIAGIRTGVSDMRRRSSAARILAIQDYDNPLPISIRSGAPDSRNVEAPNPAT